MNYYHFFVSGKVQGVGFRYFTYKVAKELDLNGYVRNTYDGKVEIIASGSEKSIEKFVKSIKKGPTFSKVLDLEINKIEMNEQYGSFVIKY